MPAPGSERLSKKEVWFKCNRYFLRTIKREDASDRWAEWLADPWTVHVLNTSPKKIGKREIVDYIRQFDQRSRLLLGIFEMGTRHHVGFVRIDLDGVGDALVNAVIGEAAHRNRGATTDVFVALLDFLFNTVGVKQVRASVLLRNQLTLSYLLKLGWQREESLGAPVRSVTDGAMLETCVVSWTRDGYYAFLRTPMGGRILRRTSTEAGPATRIPGADAADGVM
jgi:RimJ/RimL family protein N-acetyltransferase